MTPYKETTFKEFWAQYWKSNGESAVLDKAFKEVACAAWDAAKKRPHRDFRVAGCDCEGCREL